MNTSPISESPNQPTLTTRATPTFYWSVKRELWENRSLYIAPIIVGAVILLGVLLSSTRLPERRRTAMLLDEAHRRMAIELHYDIAAMMILITGSIVGLFYCLDALYGERRDRSILFWKSLPVSDVTTVLSKVSIPMLVLPPIVFGITVVMQFIMLLISTAVLMPSGLAGTSWANFNLAQQSVIMLYSVIVITLWHAPIYGWALLVSGVARRATFLWAILPFLAIGIFEKITFNTSYFTSILKNRIFGAGDVAFNLHHSFSIDSLSQLTPGRFLSAPGLWLGLIFAAAFVVGAIRLRRYRTPL